jgi:hypothetical protein
VCRLFANHGYPSGGPDERIYYLATDQNIECGDGNPAPDWDALPGKANLQLAITTWAASKGLGPNRALTLYLIDHGNPGVIYLNGRNETVSPDELNAWLNQLEASAPGVRVNIVIEACYSGSFINGLQRLSQPDKQRVIIASTSSDMVAYASSDGAAFSDVWWGGVGRGLSLYSAFEDARYAHLLQTPWIDDNGNGIANDPTDGQEAARRGFGYAGTLANEQWPPYIARAEVGPVVKGRAVITAEIRDDKSVLNAWATVYRPSYQLPAGEEMVQETLPTFMLTDPNGDHLYTGIYEVFNEVGEYRVALYAVDGEGLQGRLKSVTVRTGWTVYLPLVRK